MTPTNNTTVTAHSLSTAIVVIGMAIWQTFYPDKTLSPQLMGAVVLAVNAVVTAFVPHPTLDTQLPPTAPGSRPDGQEGKS